MLHAMTLSRIDAGDAGLRKALEQAGLPSADSDEPQTVYFALADEGAPIAFGGIAGTGADRLLRSVVVPESARRAGIGSRIVALLESEARRDGSDRLWLLTVDAAGFFERTGWRAADRAAAPDSIRRSAQFASICPASATLMVRELTA